MCNILIKILLSLGLSGFITAGFAGELLAPKTALIPTDNLVATVRFSAPEQGDLYLATILPNGSFFFITETIGFSATPVAFKKNQTYSGDYTLLNLPVMGLSAGTYPLYELVVNANADPFDVNSWVGGFQGLHILNFTVQAATQTTGTSTTTSSSTTDTSAGKSLYTQYCASCHGSSYSPATSASSTRRAINNNSGGMGSLSSLSDAQLTQIASYIQTVAGTTSTTGRRY